MGDRRGFLAALGATGTLLVRPHAADAAVPEAPLALRADDDAARAAAASMRRFDPRLTDADVAKIAKAIEASRKEARALNPHASPLRNGDEPATTFAAADA